MSLKRRLKRRDDQRKTRIEKLRNDVEAVKKRGQRKAASGGRRAARGERRVGLGLPGKLTETTHGPVHMVDAYLEPRHHHGSAPVAPATEVSGAIVAEIALDPSFASLDFSQALFLDTETTGLAGGTGTVAFLIGMAWFEDQSLRVQQLFLPEFGQEEAMLRLLSERLEKSSCLVSYNGKSFDWPLLRNRFVINRVKAPRVSAHLDLLHCARRIFKPRLQATRLVDLERAVLGMYRHDDVPGSLIPSLYFDYLDGCGAEALLGVFEHNAHDLIALAALLGKLAAHFEEVRAADDPRDHLAYAKVAERAGDRRRAREFAQAAAKGGAGADCTVDALMLQARLARRDAELEAEERALVGALAVADGGASSAGVRLALAKLYEHRIKDFTRALEHAPHTCPAEPEDATHHRVQRLERRIARRGSRRL